MRRRNLPPIDREDIVKTVCGREAVVELTKRYSRRVLKIASKSISSGKPFSRPSAAGRSPLSLREVFTACLENSFPLDLYTLLKSPCGGSPSV
jgi:hypothetical protein